ncbi:MAG TPA: sugar phosphate isomerase/epimerase family protein [Verrucomicrobiota bacterium]|nr:sugar phosphate isomerase/epimerase family protein [Verrucomicrobiota bacterium]
MKFAICNEVFEGWNLESAFEFVASVGYDAVEIAPFTIAPRVTDVSASQRIHIRNLAQRAGLEIAGIHWVLAKTDGFHVTHPDESVRARTARYCEELVRFCSDLGGRIIVFGSPKQRSKLPGVTSAQASAWAVETLAPAGRLAQTRNVTICFEPLSPAETDFINTANEAIKFARMFDSPAAKIILDVKAMCSESQPIPDIIRASAPHFAHFHANDRNLKGPGFGDVDFRPIAAALREVAYSGYVSVEVFDFSDGPETIAARSLSYLKESFASNPQQA